MRSALSVQSCKHNRDTKHRNHLIFCLPFVLGYVHFIVPTERSDIIPFKFVFQIGQSPAVSAIGLNSSLVTPILFWTSNRLSDKSRGQKERSLRDSLRDGERRRQRLRRGAGRDGTCRAIHWALGGRLQTLGRRSHSRSYFRFDSALLDLGLGLEAERRR